MRPLVPHAVPRFGRSSWRSSLMLSAVSAPFRSFRRASSISLSDDSTGTLLSFGRPDPLSSALEVRGLSFGLFVILVTMCLLLEGERVRPYFVPQGRLQSAEQPFDRKTPTERGFVHRGPLGAIEVKHCKDPVRRHHPRQILRVKDCDQVGLRVEATAHGMPPLFQSPDKSIRHPHVPPASKHSISVIRPRNAIVRNRTVIVAMSNVIATSSNGRIVDGRG